MSRKRDAGTRSGMRAMKLVLSILLPVVSILGCWYAAIGLTGLPEFVLPRPDQVMRAMIDEHALIGANLLVTLEAAGLGFLFANLVGIGLAGILAMLPWLSPLIMPATIALRNIPYVALATVLALVSGDTMTSKVLIVAVAGFFPVLVNTARGLRSVDPVILDRMHILGVGSWRMFWQVRLPFAVPFIVAAQEIVGSASIVTAVAAEWMISSSGLGYVINRGMAQYRGDEVYAVALIAALLSWGVYMLVQLAGRYVDQGWGSGHAGGPQR